MIKIEHKGKLIEGSFQARINRFSARVSINDQAEMVYVANSGRMKELLLPGAKVFLVEREGLERKTRYDLVGVYSADALVSIDSRVPNLILAKAFNDDSLAVFNGLTKFKREFTIGNSRLDFMLDYPQGECFVEAKSVTLVEGITAKFPDAPTIRGSKHLLELIDLVQEGYRSAVIFIIQREDALNFSPNSERDPEFAQNLKKAKEAGVEVYAFTCKVTLEAITLDREVPVLV